MRGILSRIDNWKSAVRERSLALIVLVFVSWTSVTAQSNQLPCNFLDSVNITGGETLSNKSIIFEGVEFKQDDYAKIDYILYRGTETISVEPHIRGCVCNHKPCIRLCCPLGSLPVIKNGKSSCTPHEAAQNIEREILDINNATKIAKIDKHFPLVSDYPCKQAYFGDEFQITHTGNILHEDTLLAHHEYCIRAVLNNETNTVDWKLLVCLLPSDLQQPVRFTILPICMLISVIFIIATLTVYMWIPKLRNLNGKCIMNYLAGLAIGYILLAYLQFNGSSFIKSVYCVTISYIIYISLLSAFLWLNVINFDLWLSFQSSCGFNRFSERKRFFLYSLYSFGIPCLLTLAIIITDQIESIPQHLRPRMGDNSCFLHSDWLTQFLYFYLPLGIIIILNIVLFVLTARRMRQMRLEAINTRSEEDSSRLHKMIHKTNEKYKLYIRLILISGLTWTLEVISFMVSRNSQIFLISDIWNCLQGVLIFILLICRRRVWNLMKEKWNNSHGSTNNPANNVELTLMSTPED